MARTVARNGAQIMVTSLQHRGARTVILFADVELLDLYAMQFGPFHCHLRFLPVLIESTQFQTSVSLIQSGGTAAFNFPASRIHSRHVAATIDTPT
jgi:hypothetical protein